MKLKLLFSFLLLSFLAFGNAAFAANLYWVGPNNSPSAPAVWGNANNWALTSGGTGGAGIPTGNDVAIFDFNSGSDCNIAGFTVVGEIKVEFGYIDWMNSGNPHSIFQNSNLLVNKITMEDGYFVSSTSPMFVRESLNISGGSFISSSNVLTFQGIDFSLTGAGAFAHNNGTVLFTSLTGGSAPVTIGGNPIFNNLRLSGGADRAINIFNTIQVNNNLTLESDKNLLINNGIIDLKGNLILSNTGTTGGGTALINFNGINQTITGTTTKNQSRLPRVSFNTGQITINNIVTFTNTLINNASSFVATGSTAVFTNATGANSAYSISGNGVTSFNNVEIDPLLALSLTINPTSVVSVSGNLTLNGVGALNLESGTISVAGNIINGNTSTLATAGGTATLVLNGTGTQTLNGRSTVEQGKFPNIMIDKPSGTLTLSNNTITLGTGADWTYINGTMNPANSTLRVIGGGSVISGSHTLNNLTFAPINSGSHLFTLANGTVLALNRDLYVDGDNSAAVTLSGGEIVMSSRDVYFYNSNPATGGNTLITMAGTGNQYISGNGTSGEGSLPSLRVNKPSGTLFINGNATVSSELIMTNGLVDMESSTFTLGTSTTNIGTLTHSAGSLSNGTFSRWFNTNAIADQTNAGLFPIGSSADFRPVYLSTSAVPTMGGTVSVMHNPATGTTSSDFSEGDDVITSYSNASWTLETGNGLTGGTYNIRINPANVMQNSDVNDLRIVVPGTATGTHGTVTGTAANPSITRTNLTPMNLNNSFNIGSKAITPLPVELISFKAEKAENFVNVLWATASEQNNAYFVIERSADGKNFGSIGQVEGAGTTTAAKNYTFLDKKPLNNVSYYRLKQVDLDGTFEYSPIVKILVTNRMLALSLNAFPNPTTDKVTVQINGLTEAATLQVIDLTGRLVTEMPIAKDAVQAEVNLTNYPAAIYHVKLVSANGATSLKVIKK